MKELSARELELQLEQQRLWRKENYKTGWARLKAVRNVYPMITEVDYDLKTGEQVIEDVETGEVSSYQIDEFRRQRECGLYVTTGSVEVIAKANGNGARFRGVTACGTASMCPRCNVTVQSKRAAEIADGMRNAAYGVTFSTYPLVQELEVKGQWYEGQEKVRGYTPKEAQAVRTYFDEVWRCQAKGIVGPALTDELADLIERGKTEWRLVAVKDEAGRTIRDDNGVVQKKWQGFPVEELIPVLITLTLPHTVADDLEKMCDVISDAWRYCLTGSFREKLRTQFGLVGTIKATEITRGSNGWHPHLHVLGFVNRSAYEAKKVRVPGQPGSPQYYAESLQSALYARWSQRIVKHGYARPSKQHGVDVEVMPDIERAAKALSLYLTKTEKADTKEKGVSSLAFELTNSQGKLAMKGGVTFWQIIDRLAVLQDRKRANENQWATDADKAEWFELKCLHNEYVYAMRGRRMLGWSNGLKDRLGIDELTDEEIAIEENEGEPEETEATLGFLSLSTWRTIYYRHNPGDFLAAACDGLEAADDWLRYRRLPSLLAEPPVSRRACRLKIDPEAVAMQEDEGWSAARQLVEV